MKKNVLALSIATMIGGLGFAGAASAGVIVGTGAAPAAGATAVVDKMQAPTIKGFAVADGGVGHALIVPYYTVQNGNMTVLHLVNTDAKSGKVAKIRFRGAANSDDVLDFQVLLSPGDVWTGAVTKGADGYANLTTADGTCSIPQLQKGVAVPFKDGRLNPNLTGDALANQTREGYVEIFNSADIPSDTIYTVGAVANTNSALYTAVKHVSGTAPCTGSAINAALFTKNFEGATDEKAAANLGLDAPTGGLMADWYIINVPQTTTYSGSATALVGVDAAGKLAKTGNFVAFPQNDAITIATPENYTSDPTLVSTGKSFLKKSSGGVGTDPTTVAPIEAIALDFPDLSTPYATGGAAAVAADALAQAASLTNALAVSSITNQYAKDASISAKTDWVFSMPTRRYSVAVDYQHKDALTGAVAPARVYSVVTGKVAGAASVPANLQYFSSDNTELVDGKVCVGTQSVVFRDREESGKTSAPVFSPSKANSTRLCGETSVLSFGEGTTAVSVLGAAVAREDVAAASLFENGWGVLNTANYPKGTLAAVQAGASIGLPILGYSVTKLTNPQVAAGMSGTYGITWAHRFTKVNP